MIGIILAAGSSSHFSGFPKQLLEIDGETLLSRQLRLFGPEIQKLVLVTHRDELMNKGVEVYRPDSHRWKLDTLLSTFPLWDEWTIVLHGDVYFTESARDKILNVRDARPAFFWDGHEVFAMTIPGDMREQVRVMAQQLVNGTAYSPKRAAENNCGLGNLMVAMRSTGRMPTVAIDIDDDTQDFDFPREVDGWNNGWRKNALRK